MSLTQLSHIQIRTSRRIQSRMQKNALGGDCPFK
jgi:hypothetical protein